MAISEAKVVGCLLGGAIGDALGAPRMGLSRTEIMEQFPTLDYAPAPQALRYSIPVAELGEAEIVSSLKTGEWTDITQLSLALCAAFRAEQGEFIPEAWAHELSVWVNQHPRTPGLSTLQAAMQLRTGFVEWDEASDPDGAGSSPAARVAPVAVRYNENSRQRRSLAALQAGVTHGHPDAQAAAVAVSEAVALCLQRAEGELPFGSGELFLTELANTVREQSESYEEFARCLRLASRLLEDRVPPEQAIQALGVSDWSRESVPCALYCAVRTPDDFVETLKTALTLTGGAVTTIAAIAGNISGALLGADAIPTEWIEDVEQSGMITTNALSLLAMVK